MELDGAINLDRDLSIEFSCAIADRDTETYKRIFHELGGKIGNDWIHNALEFNFDALFYFLDHGVNPNIRKENGWTILHSMVSQAEVYRQQFQNAFNPDPTDWEALLEQRKMIQRFVDHYDVDVNAVLPERNFNSETPLDILSLEDWTYDYLVLKGAKHSPARAAEIKRYQQSQHKPPLEKPPLELDELLRQRDLPPPQPEPVSERRYIEMVDVLPTDPDWWEKLKQAEDKPDNE